MTSVNGFNFSWLQGFGMMVDFNTSYYVVDFPTNQIFLLNENYDYVVKKNFSNPKYMVTANSNLYIAGDAIIWKTDT